MMLNPNIVKAYRILDGENFEKDFFMELSKIEGEDILDLVSLANKVKNRYAGERHICTILNAKSGICNEDCSFCSQSSHHDTDTDIYGLKTREEILKSADDAFSTGVKSFGIVTSGTGYMKPDSEFREITGSIDLIKDKYPERNVCVSLGNLGDDSARELSKHNVLHYNINIQTNPDRYNELIASTHNAGDRINTIRLLKKYGIGVCSGGIIGLGENMADRIELAFILKELDVDVIPLNVLIQIDGTPLENTRDIAITEIAKTFAIFRLIHPSRTIKFAAGRDTKMKDFQGLLMLAGANGFITGGYLTTRGRDTWEDLHMLEELKQFN